MAHRDNSTGRRPAPVQPNFPVMEKVCTGKDLARILSTISLPDSERAAWLAELKEARRRLRELPLAL
jgi:hypothetical protein